MPRWVQRMCCCCKADRGPPALPCSSCWRYRPSGCRCLRSLGLAPTWCLLWSRRSPIRLPKLSIRMLGFAGPFDPICRAAQGGSEAGGVCVPAGVAHAGREAGALAMKGLVPSLAIAGLTLWRESFWRFCAVYDRLLWRFEQCPGLYPQGRARRSMLARAMFQRQRSTAET